MAAARWRSLAAAGEEPGAVSLSFCPQPAPPPPPNMLFPPPERPPAARPSTGSEHDGPPSAPPEEERSATWPGGASLAVEGRSKAALPNQVFPKALVREPRVSKVSASTNFKLERSNTEKVLAYDSDARFARPSQFAPQTAFSKVVQRAHEEETVLHRWGIKAVNHPLFNTVTATVIIANSVTIGWESDYMAGADVNSEEPGFFSLIDGAFTVFFTLELFEQLLSTVDTSSRLSGVTIFRALRALRLVRILRLARIMRMIGELRAIISSLAGSMRPLFWTLVLLAMLIYIVGVYFTQAIADYRRLFGESDNTFPATEEHRVLHTHFGSLARSILVLFQSVTGGIDWDSIVRPMFSEVGWSCGIIFIAYIAFTVLALLNVVTGVFIDMALKSAKQDQDIYMVNQVWELFKVMDADDSGRVCWDEFSVALDTAEMQEYFKEIDVDIAEAEGIFHLLDVNNEDAIRPMEFLSGCMRLRGPAKALDMRLLMKKQRRFYTKFVAHTKRVDEALAWICQSVGADWAGSV